jgi:hypothetical protein
MLPWEAVRKSDVLIADSLVVLCGVLQVVQLIGDSYSSTNIY